MVGLDLTHQAGATPEAIERIATVGTPLATKLDTAGFWDLVVDALERIGEP